MRYARKTALALLIALSLMATACPESKSLASLSHSAVAGIDQAVPIFQSNGVDVSKLVKVRGFLADAEIAFNEQRTDDAIGFISSAIKMFDSVKEDVLRLANPTVRTIILVGLAVVNLRLQALSEKMAASPHARDVRTPGAAVIAKHAKSKRWTCRNSVSGRFEKMSFCKANPSQSTVETN